MYVPTPAKHGHWLDDYALTSANVSLPDGMYVASGESELGIIRFGRLLMIMAIGLAIVLAICVTHAI